MRGVSTASGRLTKAGPSSSFIPPPRPSPMTRLTLAIPTGLGVLLLGTSGCDTPTCNSPRPTVIEVVRPPSPVGVPSWALKDTILIRVVDSSGHPRVGEALRWTVRTGGGALQSLDATTDSGGFGRAIWTLGALAGMNQADVRTWDDSIAWTAEAGAFRVDRLDSSYDLGCGLREGDLWCWPWARTEAVSIGPPWAGGTATFGGPTLVASGEQFTDVAVGAAFACALTSTHIVKCYSAGPPVQPGTPPLRTLVGTGGQTFCGLAMADSTAWCWRVVQGPITATQVPGSGAFVAISIEGGQDGQPGTACGLRADSTIACWGTGPLGNGATGGSASPQPIASSLTFASVTAGDGFACGRRANGDTWCWGSNTAQRLGRPGGDALTPVLSATAVAQVAAGMNSVGAVQGSKAVRWGLFGDGAGHPLTPLGGLPDIPVASFSDNVTSCLRLGDGQVYCYLELWVASSTLDLDLYLPLQPIPQASR